MATDKPASFIGREALQTDAGEPRPRRLFHLKLEDPGPQLFHGESVLHDGAVVGRVTSGAYGHTLGAAVGFALLEAPPQDFAELLSSGAVEVDIAGSRAPATLSARPFYDPDGARLRS